LRRTEKELRDLVENMPAMAGVLLPNGSHTYLTNQWREYSGLSENVDAFSTPPIGKR
jgi:PAS domain-containing protein